MPLSVVELFGYAPNDQTSDAQAPRKTSTCPFVGGQCIKRFKSGLISGACSLKPTNSGAVICCPNRMYGDNYKILLDVAQDAFGPNMRLCHNPAEAKCDGGDVVVFGKHWGKELRLPNRRKRGGYFVDWILAHLNPDRSLHQFVAIEVQTMDTTGSYEAQVHRYLNTGTVLEEKGSNINWENVAKRILPQIIYKGHVLRREPRCAKGMYFICPSPVYATILQRLGGSLSSYHQQPGTVTFRHYDLGPDVPPGSKRNLEYRGQATTTIDQVALAFTSPSNLPEPGVYELAIRAGLEPKHSTRPSRTSTAAGPGSSPPPTQPPLPPPFQSA